MDMNPFASVPFGGLRIIVSHAIERPIIGTAVEARRTERWFELVLRLFGVHPFTWIPRGPIYGNAPIYRMGDRIICRPETYEALRRDIRSHDTRST